MNGWNMLEPQNHLPLKRKKSSEPNFHDFGFKKFFFQGVCVFFFFGGFVEIREPKNIKKCQHNGDWHSGWGFMQPIAPPVDG